MIFAQKMHKVFIQGPIDSKFIQESITKHGSKTDIGAHCIFLGQVRADNINNNTVLGIEYSAYEELAIKTFNEIKEECFKKFDISCLHIFHSLGYVKAGEISLFVFVSSKHRKSSFDACEWLVEEIKKRVPVYGKEILDNDGYKWKENLF